MVWLYLVWEELLLTPPLFQALFLVAFGFLILSLLLLVYRFFVLLKSKKSFVEFYDSRGALNRVRGGIERELENSDKVWVACHGATYFATLSPESRKKVKKLLLIHPNSTILPMYSYASPETNIQDLKSDILKATELYQGREKGTEVRWFNGLFNLITLLDPGTKKAQARVEVWLFEESSKRQNYVINQKTNQEAYKAILDTFNKMWNDKQWCQKPPKNLDEFRKKPSLGTPSSSS